MHRRSFEEQGLISAFLLRYRRPAKLRFAVVSIATANRLTFIITGFGAR
jgi:hypothetical protein